MAEKKMKVYPKDAPWISTKLKDLIRLRQFAFHSNRESILYKFYRNAVNKERKLCRAKYYASKVHDLKGVNPRQWWKEVRKLSGSSRNNNTDLLDVLDVPEYEGLSRQETANAINTALLEPLQTYEPLDCSVAYIALEDDAEFLKVSTLRVYNTLIHLNKYKASGPDGVPNWFYKEYAELVAEPVTNILNASFRDQKLPSGWKLADISPLPKVKQVKDPKKELRRISLTSSLSKVAEEFVVADYVKPAVVKSIDPNQYGTISGSSTVMALISMFHQWLQGTDGTSSSERILLFDYRKAFDLIDHATLVRKLKHMDLPHSIINWIISFLTCRSQRVKLGQDRFSEWGVVPSGVPQGTKLGPWLFLVMINDLTISGPFSIWKYVDDTTVLETVVKGELSKAQQAADQVHEWSRKNLFQLNSDKTKDLIISFNRSSQEQSERSFPTIYIDGKSIRRVTSAKLLGVTINSSLTWNDHIEDLVKRAYRKLYFLVQLKRTRVPQKDLVTFYCTCIRSSMDYASPVFHYALPKYLQVDLERVQKRALSCIFPGISYNDALVMAGIDSIHDHHEFLTRKLFKSISKNSNNKLNYLLPRKNLNNTHNLRKKRIFAVPLIKTKRFSNSFIIHSCNICNNE